MPVLAPAPAVGVDDFVAVADLVARSHKLAMLLTPSEHLAFCARRHSLLVCHEDPLRRGLQGRQRQRYDGCEILSSGRLAGKPRQQEAAHVACSEDVQSAAGSILDVR